MGDNNEMREAFDFISLSVSYIFQQNKTGALDQAELKAVLLSIQEKAAQFVDEAPQNKGWLREQMAAAERSIATRPEWISKSYSDESRLTVPATTALADRAAIRKEALEEAAKVCANRARQWAADEISDLETKKRKCAEASDCAEAIRKLAEQGDL